MSHDFISRWLSVSFSSSSFSRCCHVCHRLECYGISLQICQHARVCDRKTLVLNSSEVACYDTRRGATHIPLDWIRSRFTTAGAAHQNLEWIRELVGSEHRNIGPYRSISKLKRQRARCTVRKPGFTEPVYIMLQTFLKEIIAPIVECRTAARPIHTACHLKLREIG